MLRRALSGVLPNVKWTYKLVKDCNFCKEVEELGTIENELKNKNFSIRLHRHIKTCVHCMSFNKFYAFFRLNCNFYQMLLYHTIGHFSQSLESNHDK